MSEVAELEQPEVEAVESENQEELESQETEQEEPQENAEEVVEDESKEEGEEAELEGEVEISIGEESLSSVEDDDQGKGLVKHLRKSHKTVTKEKRALETELEALKQSIAQNSVPEVQEIGEEPTLAGHDYDEDAFRESHAKWIYQDLDRKREQSQIEEQNAKAKEQWDGKVEGYEESKKNLTVRDYDDVEETIIRNIDDTNRGIIINNAKNPAALFYAIAKKPELLKEFSAMNKNPEAFLWRAAQLEPTVNITARKPKTKPEGIVTSTGEKSLKSSDGDAHLAKLEARADKGNDRSEVVAYRLKLREAKRNKTT